MAPGRAHDLLARLALALATASAPLVACGGETTDGSPAQSGGGGTGGTGGGVSGGTGGSVATGGTTGTAGAGGTFGAGGSLACTRPLPEAGSQGFGKACRTQTECPGGAAERCLLPDEPVCSFGGAPMPPTCADDAACDQGTDAFWVCQDYDDGRSSCRYACTRDDECEASRFCDTKGGHCERRTCSPDSAPCNPGTFCAPDFTCRTKQCDADRPCGLGLSCDPQTFACRAQSCVVGDFTSCPDTFTCTNVGDGAAAVCVRSTCVCDTQCGQSGFCLAGTCYEGAGTCAGNVACGRPILVEGAPRLAPLIASPWG